MRGFALLLLFLSPPPEGATGEGVAGVAGESVGIVLEVVERSTSTEQGLVVQLATTVGGRSSFKELEPRAACSNTSGHVPHKQWMAEVHRL